MESRVGEKMTKKLLNLVFILIFFFPTLSFSAPRRWGFAGTATTSNTSKTVGNSSPFNPSSVCVKVDSGSDTYFNIGAAATTTNDSTNFLVKSTDPWMCFNLNYTNVYDSIVVGAITASSTSTYRIQAIQQ